MASVKRHLVTGGTGFLGSALVRRLVAEGQNVRVLDNQFRGAARRLEGVTDRIELFEADIRDAGAVQKAARGVDAVWHLAFINGTRYFYTHPQLVLEVGIKGILNVLEACSQQGVRELFVASSSEVYQKPPAVPTGETVPLSIPDPHNPRYSYAAGKILSEIMTIHCGRGLRRAVLFRPHNVYGPDMGWEHVIPQFVLRMRELARNAAGPVRFPIQGDGCQTRAFVYVDDFVDGLMRILERGEHLNIYNVGSEEEIQVAAVAKEVGRYFKREVEIVPGKPAPGGVERRCPDTAKLRALGYRVNVPFKEGLARTARWYDENAGLVPKDVSVEVS